MPRTHLFRAAAHSHTRFLALLLGSLSLIGCSKPSRAPEPESSAPNPRAVELKLPTGPEAIAAIEQGRIHFDTYACWRCHSLGTEELPGMQDFNNLGPDLQGLGARLPAEDIYQSLTDPNRIIAEPRLEHLNEQGFSKMPSFEQVIPKKELLELTTFLASLDPPPSRSTPVKVSEETFATEVLESDSLILLDFWAEWCVPCLELEPILEELAAEQGSRLKICKINVDDNPKLVAEYVPDNMFPCLILIKNQALKDRVYGTDPNMEPKAFLDQWIRQHAED